MPPTSGSMHVSVICGLSAVDTQLPPRIGMVWERLANAGQAVVPKMFTHYKLDPMRLTKKLPTVVGSRAFHRADIVVHAVIVVLPRA